MYAFEPERKPRQTTHTHSAPPRRLQPRRALGRGRNEIHPPRSQAGAPGRNPEVNQATSSPFSFGRLPVHTRDRGGAQPAGLAADPLFQHDPLETTTPDVDVPADEAEPLAGAPKLAEIKLITGKDGAFSGFPVIDGIDLSVPGPFNDTQTTGTCVNVHQMQFRLSEGDPAEVKLIRKVIRVAVAGGKEHRKGEKDKPADDGPSAPTVIRPKDSSSVVVADAPGFKGKGDASKSSGVFPVSYDADFQLFAIDPIAPKILGKMTYTVRVSKQTYDDASPVNEIKEKSRKIF